jgi:hypothetical protein
MQACGQKHLIVWRSLVGATCAGRRSDGMNAILVEAQSPCGCILCLLDSRYVRVVVYALCRSLAFPEVMSVDDLPVRNVIEVNGLYILACPSQVWGASCCGFRFGGAQGSDCGISCRIWMGRNIHSTRVC